MLSMVALFIIMVLRGVVKTKGFDSNKITDV